MRSLSKRRVLGRCAHSDVCENRKHPVRRCREIRYRSHQANGKTHGKPKEKIDIGKTGDGQSFFINEYPATKKYSQWERIAYVQLPKAVAYIVLSSRGEASYRKDASALREVLKTFAYLEPKLENKKN